MKRSTDITLHAIFFAIVVIELVGRWFDNVNLEYPVKPLIMVWIAMYFLLKKRKNNFTLPVMLAFFFAWVGDILLMFSGYTDKPMVFFGGVGGFFITQTLYIYIFIRYNEVGGAGFVRKRMYFALIFMAYLGGLLYLILPKIDPAVMSMTRMESTAMKLIISIYGISLLLMSMMALNRKGRVGSLSFLLVFLGSVLFVLSDSMIALSRFDVLDVPKAGFWIMLTYIPAQYLIMRGLTKEKEIS